METANKDNIIAKELSIFVHYKIQDMAQIVKFYYLDNGLEISF